MPAVETVTIAIRCADSSVAVMSFVVREYQEGSHVPRWTRQPSTENIDAEVARASAAFDPSKLPVQGWRILGPLDQLPADRTYRDAWKDEGGSIVHDMPRAREIHRNLIRDARVAQLSALDVEYQRADELGPSPDTDAVKGGIAARKQALRDAPQDPAIEAAQTPEELKAVWPLAQRA